MPYTFERHFSLEEANGTIPALKRAFAQVRRFSKAAQAGESSGANGNGHKRPKMSPMEASAQANRLLRGIAELGVVVQDWQRGLVDFPHLRDGHEVFLCYELADGDEIRYFHELDAGYAGRKPV